MFCIKCGKELNEDQNICPHCGTFVKEKVNINTSNEIHDRNSLIGFVLGFVCITTCAIPIIGFATSICGIVFSSKGLKSELNKGKAIAGLVLSIIFLIFSICYSFITILFRF